MKIGVLGGTGFVGCNVMHRLRTDQFDCVAGSRRTGVNAFSVDSITHWIEQNKITHLVNLAAECGGIGLNKKKPADLWYSTTQISASVLRACVEARVMNLVQVGTVCSYAKFCPTPFKESDLMHHGDPEETNLSYGISKLNSLYGARSYAKQYGINVTNLVPVNMYGPNDDFDPETSHAIPAIMRKIHAAKVSKAPKIQIWGTGKASREFLYADDFAWAVEHALLTVTDAQFINVGTGREVTIADLVGMIKKAVGYDVEIEWDATKPDGQPRRCLDISRARDLFGFEPKTTLEDGLLLTYDWYQNAHLKNS